MPGLLWGVQACHDQTEVLQSIMPPEVQPPQGGVVSEKRTAAAVLEILSDRLRRVRVGRDYHFRPSSERIASRACRIAATSSGAVLRASFTAWEVESLTPS